MNFIKSERFFMPSKQILIVILFFISKSALSSLSCSYKAFDLKIQKIAPPDKVKYKTRATPVQKLELASIITDESDKVLSDSPFISFMYNGQNIEWVITKGVDSQFALENTIAEIYGYLTTTVDSNLLGTKFSKLFLQKSTLEALNNLTMSDFLHYPILETGLAVAQALKKILPSDPDRVDKILVNMSKKNNTLAEFGMPHFSRPSLLSAQTLTETKGNTDLLFCTAIAYGIDYYRAPQSKYAEASKKVGMEALRSSIMDLMASAALKQFKQHNYVSNKFKVTYGNLNCRLKESQALELKPIVTYRCPAVTQGNPIIRSTHPISQKFVQIGRRLYYPECSIKGMEGTKFYPGDEITSDNINQYNNLLSGLYPYTKDSELMKIIGKNSTILSNPSEKFTNDYELLAKRCDEIYTKSEKSEIALPIDQPQIPANNVYLK